MIIKIGEDKDNVFYLQDGQEKQIQKRNWGTIVNNEKIKDAIIIAVQDVLDKTAQSRSYDGILSLCSYANSTNLKFSAEGKAGVRWRDEVWSKCYEIMNDVLLGNREVPTVEDVLKGLPEIEW